VVRALIFVMCVTSDSVKRAVLKNINAYILVSALIFVMCVIRDSVDCPIC